MTKRMLIDASHPEETRVVVVDDDRLEEFDFESTTKKQLKGNIYLAKVTRVEPSLQAAFVDYGGNRHGFLAFSEIHPDYYQIPHADRRVLEEANRVEQAQADAAQAEGNGAADEHDADAEAVATDPEEEAAEVFDEQARRRSQLLRSYKIQEVIKRRQILLVQVVKEERGNKGAALTTYLSLAGRYCVLMPNTGRGGGISRKIANPADRARLKAIAREIDVPEGMGLIIRTAGQARNKQEIRRDYEYLLRLWNDIRELTLRSIAPCVIHEEGALVQRAIRDLYARDVDEVLVEGEEGYRAARKIMGMLMPSRRSKVRLYREDVPLFHRYHVEERLDAMHSPVVQLKSGGSIVIHTTEALTAIDVNSGRSTRERNIEETALKTNLEAAEEIARQLRLRDLAGLVVVDFIDMSEMRNQRSIERKFRDALKSDRARVQIGRISAFGLLELSRQRLRPSFQELSTQPCPTCRGLGAIRSTESAALQALRALELEGMKGTSASLALTLPLAAALYLLNHKRERLVGLEQRYDMQIDVAVGEGLIAGDFRLETLEARSPDQAPAPPAPQPVAAEADDEDQGEDEVEDEDGPAAQPAAAEEDADAAGKRRRRRRRRRKRGDEAEAPRLPARAGVAGPPASEVAAAPAAADMAGAADDEAGGEEAARPEDGPAVTAAASAEPEDGDGSPPKRRRRRARPERPARRRREPAAADSVAAAVGEAEGEGEEVGVPGPEVPGPEPAPLPAASPLPLAAAAHEDESEGEDEPGPLAAAAPAQGEEAGGAADEGEMPAAADGERRGDAPPRRGWWSRFVRKDE